MPEAKRPDPKRRSPTSRPKSGKSEAARGRPRGTSPARREPRSTESRPAAKAQTKAAEAQAQDEPKDTADSIRKSIAVSAEQQSEQRFGSAARRAAILAAVVCVLTLTIAGPVRTYFGQRTEMKQLKATEEQLRAQIAELEQQKVKLNDPVFIAAQARERLGFVMPGEIPYQVQLPPGSAVPVTPGDAELATVDPDQPWYTALWGTIADAPYGVAPAPPPGPPGPAPLPPAPSSAPAGG
ncbi:septum formation initiator family protein [Mycobacterium barrassiae]|uniref:FtsB family cell division protein n=1 Tax=Mycobacterium barrassiae TaxID=319709 RepID=UPI002265C125|nr:septum formation initiator family protein [Mycobacterium barrassiae]MCV7301180.1 septum formation initiator family protein [Mycobacterium barrassiae]